MPERKNNYKFLEGGGEMGELIRHFDWEKTAVGKPDTWPHSLRTAVGIVLHSKFPMFLWWGKDLVQFYNDAYRPSLGNEGKHPTALGNKGEDTWQEIWPIIKPLMDIVLAGGEATWSEDQLIPIYRNGTLEDVYWTFSYSPVYNEAGDVAGILVTCTETTRAVKNTKFLEESRQRLENIFTQVNAGIAQADLRGVYTDVNDRFAAITGYSKKELIGRTISSITYPEDIDKGADLLKRCIENGENFFIEKRYIRKDGAVIWVNNSVSLVTAADGSRFVAAVCIDITDIKARQQQVDEIQQQLLSSFEESPVGIAFIHRDDLKFVMANSFYGELVGRKPADLIGLPLLDALPELKGQGFDELLQEVIRSGKAYTAEEVKVELIRKDIADTIYVDLHYQPRFDNKAKVTGMLVVATDVTQQVISRKIIESSEAKFRSLIEEAPIATCLFTGREHIIELANEPMIRFLGKGDSVKGKPLTTAVPELIGQPFPGILDHIYATGETYTGKASEAKLEVEGVMQTFYFDFTYKPIFDAAGKIYGIMDMSIDVTDEVLARRKLEEKEIELSAAVELAGLATWSLDVRKEVFSYSPRFMKWLGFSEDTKGLDDAYNPLPEEYRETVPAAVEAVLAPGSDGIYENEHPIVNRLTGQVRIIHSQARVFYDADGSPLYLRGTAQDITEQKNTRLALEQQVRIRTEELAISNEELMHSNEELAQYAYVASHDLQEPLRKIRIFSSMLKEQRHLSGENDSIVDKINQSAERMNLLIRDLLEFSRLLNSHSSVRVVDLNETIKAVISDFEMLVRETGALISIGELPVIHAVGLQMNQLFFNILSNGLKFSKAGAPPQISISSKRITGEEVPVQTKNIEPGKIYHHIIFRDQGIGFDAAFAEKIFEVFQRLHGRDSYPGSGIGLALCRRIVTNHGGHIYADSEPGKGTAFHIILPEGENTA